MEMNVHYVNDRRFTAYSDKSVTIGGHTYSTNIIINMNEISPFLVTQIKNMGIHNLENVIKHHPDLILFGTGNKIIYPHFDLLEKLTKNGIGFEVMSIQALCRTYNFLISESRKVVCILFFQ